MERVVIVSAARTPFGKYGGALGAVRSTDLGCHVIQEVIRRGEVEPSEVEFVCMGHVQPDVGMTPTRQAVLAAGLPQETVSLSIDRACCSGLSAVGLARTQILAGEYSIAIAGGMENMSATPMLLHDARWGTRLGAPQVEDPNVMLNPFLKMPRVVYVGKAALEYGVDREQQDRWALRSQQYYAAAQQAGAFDTEITPIQVAGKKGAVETLTRDEHPRPDTTYDKLAALPTVYGSPTITAGNAPGLNDGGGALLVMSETTSKQMGKRPLATILSYTAVSGEPAYSVRLPATAIRKALGKAGLELQDMKRIEINEAYAAMALVSTLVLGQEKGDVDEIREKTNVNGGAIAMGHPLAASGARVLMTLVYELARRGGGYGVAAICGGIGQADAMVIQVD